MDNRKKYLEPTLEIYSVSTADIITSSPAGDDYEGEVDWN